MFSKKPFVLALILLTALLVACGGTGTDAPDVMEPATEMPESGSEADTASAAAKAQLASDLGIDESEIEVISAEMTEFTDSCLGLGQANESCLQAITPGWLVMLSAGGQEYEAHTDATAEQVRIAGQTN